MLGKHFTMMTSFYVIPRSSLRVLIKKLKVGTIERLNKTYGLLHVCTFFLFHLLQVCLKKSMKEGTFSRWFWLCQLLRYKFWKNAFNVFFLSTLLCQAEVHSLASLFLTLTIFSLQDYCLSLVETEEKWVLFNLILTSTPWWGKGNFDYSISTRVWIFIKVIIKCNTMLETWKIRKNSFHYYRNTIG